MRYGYVHTNSDSAVENAKSELLKFSPDKIWVEASASKLRPVMANLILELSGQDVIVVASMKQISSKLDEMESTLDQIVRRGAALLIMDMPVFLEASDFSRLYDLTRAVDQSLQLVLEGRASIKKRRQRAGIESAKKRGVYTGKHIEYGPDSRDRHKRYVYERASYMLKENKISKAQIARELNISRTTVYRIDKELRAQLRDEPEEKYNPGSVQAPVHNNKSADVEAANKELMERIPEVLKIMRNI
ncbi:helix-turn-helix domain-containing protein [Lacticaseibacillus suibinensis]|uniref:helix-turn-helix domain-containing protein n=1 Tax=Lacticaseibacillus suibinensis TaxID=2486011 RepID=UPI0019429715|nr:recombinase family protein [Lacticaseibacillus suibinensis]